MPPTVTVAVCQLAPVIGDVAGNVARAVEAVRAACDRGAGLVVLPELVTTGYAFADRDELRPLAEPVSGPSVSAFAEAAAALARRHGRPVVVVGGFAELDEDDVLRNSAFVVSADADGSPASRAVYRKAHLWDDENDLFVPGDQPPTAVETPLGRIGVVICYDLEFPEWVRTIALQGIDVLCAPTNWPVAPRPAGERPIEVTRAQASASIDRIFVATCDRVGTERGVEWVGGSAIIHPDGHPLALAQFTATGGEGGEQTLLAQCDLADARRKGTSAHNGVVSDRRPELYGAVVRPRT
ncbi:nitrilase-related carbon-nitrogen hydrolase [Angustibacter sp. Root456]|uniref:nitrilase-related carbon-nitrogen hydrolase n=1 Tax=Angustibacter sp. Root456 TaxID=1736539 RepID=UPI0006F44C28|nr:nitrilase-related carbon-nitrogen hydrolase [Angustibacter sp. Root456]KQX62695.1 carbon-nitrogen hydrolase [Angustibacter sp. Root456]